MAAMGLAAVGPERAGLSLHCGHVVTLWLDWSKQRRSPRRCRFALSESAISVMQTRQRVEAIFEDQDRLAREVESNPIFDHLTGYICSVEQGRATPICLVR